MRINGQIVRWLPVGEGGFNKTYVSQHSFSYDIDGIAYHQRWVLKVPKKRGQDELTVKMNHSSRAVRLWNELNPSRPAVELPEQGGWLAPYVPGLQASDEAITQKQIELYRDKGRIVVDACGNRNFIAFNGEVICVDVDAAVNLDSPISRRILREVVEIDQDMENYQDYWKTYATYHGMKNAVQMTKTLLYLDNQLKHKIIPKQYISAEILKDLHLYQQQKMPITQVTLERLYRRHHVISEPSYSILNYFGLFSSSETEHQPEDNALGFAL